MSIEYSCRHCQRPVSAPDELAGKTWRCAEGCGQLLRVPRWGVGQTFAGRWRVRKILEGGMGWVYVAQDLEILRQGIFQQVAFKSFKDASNPSHTRSFLREARHWIEAGHHPHLVTALLVQELEGWPLLEMEYVHGSSLKAWISRRRLSIAQTVDFAVQLCEGMEYVSCRAGLVHRDLKPSNLLIDDLNVLKITDLGISAPPSAGPGGVGPGGGTPLYMSPEQFDALQVDSRADIYSTGVVLYEMCLGEPPFRGRGETELKRLHQTQEPVAPRRRNPAVPEELDEIVMRCLAKDPATRFPGFAELGAALRQVAATLPVRKPPVGPRQREPTEFEKALKLCYSMLQLGNFEAARRHGEELIRLQPENAEAWNNTGVALSKLDRLDEAQRSLERALELKPDYVQAMANLGGVLFRQGCFGEARQLLEQAVAADPHYAEAWANLGACLATGGEIDEGFACFDRASAEDGSYWKVWEIRANVCLELGRPAEALECCRKIEMLHQPSVWVLRARVWMALGRAGEALAVCEEGLEHHRDLLGLWAGKIIALDALKEEERLGEFLEKAVRRFPAHSDFLLGRGLWLSRQGLTGQAAESFGRVTELAPENGLAWEFHGEMLLELARPDEALLCYRRAVALLPRKASAWKGLGVCCHQLGQHQEAFTSFARAAEIDPQDPETQQALAISRRIVEEMPQKEAQERAKGSARPDPYPWLSDLERGETEAALAELNRALEQDPENLDALQIRGSCHLSLGLVAEAAEDLDRAIELDPGSSLARAMKARVLSRLGQPKEALRQARSATEMEGGGYLAFQILGEIAQEQGACEEAASAFGAALEGLADARSGLPQAAWRKWVAECHYHRGVCLKQVGRFGEALEQLRRAIQLTPDNPAVQAELRDFE